MFVGAADGGLLRGGRGVGVGVDAGVGCVGDGDGDGDGDGGGDGACSAVGEEVGGRAGPSCNSSSRQRKSTDVRFLGAPGSARSQPLHATHADDPGKAMVLGGHGVQYAAPAAAAKVPVGQMAHGAPGVAA